MIFRHHDGQVFPSLAAFIAASEAIPTCVPYQIIKLGEGNSTM
jgi:hypothetical protein